MAAQFPTPQTGLDYSKLKGLLNQSKLQKENQSLFQLIDSTIEGLRKFQGFLEERFGGLESNLSANFDVTKQILAELVERNSTKYSISLTNSATQPLPDSTLTLCTFDTTIYDDGLMFVTPDTIKIKKNAQWLICGRIRFSIPTPALVPGVTFLLRASVHLNGRRQFSTSFSSEQQPVIIVPFVGLVEALDEDLITLYAYCIGTGVDIDITPSIQMFRVTYVNKGTGRNVIEGEDGSSQDPGSGGGGPSVGQCDPTIIGPPAGPSWYTSLLASAPSFSNCWNPVVLAETEGGFNSAGYIYQRNSAGEIRGRLFPISNPQVWDKYIDTNRPDNGWGWFQNY